MPAPVRQTYATGKGVIGEAEKPDAPLTLRDRTGGRSVPPLWRRTEGARRHLGILARDQPSGSCERDDAQIRMCTVVLVLLNRLRRP